MFLQVGNTPLHHSAAPGNPELVKILLDKGCDINAQGEVS